MELESREPMDLQAIHWCLRVTARISFVFFLCAFAGRAAARFWPGAFGRWIDSRKRTWIAAFAASHTFHLAFIIALAMNLGEATFVHSIRLHGLIGGGFTYLLIYALALAAAFPDGLKPLQSDRFQDVAYYLIWAVFALAFLGSVRNSWINLPFAIAAVVALPLRVFAAGEKSKAAGLSPASR